MDIKVKNDFWDILEKNNPVLRMNRQAYHLYYQDCEDVAMDYNTFCDNEDVKLLYIHLLREKKLKRVI